MTAQTARPVPHIYRGYHIQHLPLTNKYMIYQNGTAVDVARSLEAARQVIDQWQDAR